MVQLHRAQHVEGGRGRGISILNSWGPIECHGWAEACDSAMRLRADNRWAGPTYFPYVTVTGEDGIQHGDHVLSPWYRGDDSLYYKVQEAQR